MMNLCDGVYRLHAKPVQGIEQYWAREVGGIVKRILVAQQTGKKGLQAAPGNDTDGWNCERGGCSIPKATLDAVIQIQSPFL